MIDNLIDAIDQVVDNLQSDEAVESSIAVTYNSELNTTTYKYISEFNNYVAGQYVEFYELDTGVRYKISTLVESAGNNFTATFQGNITNIVNESKVKMRPFVKYKYDNYKNIQKQLIEEGKSSTLKKNKYPLLALILPYEEERGKEFGVIMETNATVVLIIDSQKNWTTADRELYSFTQNLRPLYDLFICKLKHSGLFQTDEFLLIPHKKTDHYFWSADKAETQNKLAAIVDAIELSNFKLILNKQSNC